MSNLLTTLRSNKFVSWFLALFMGLVFHHISRIIKNLLFIWIQSWDFGTSTQPGPESTLLIMTITFNFAGDFISSLIAALIYGALLVYVFQEKAFLLCLGAVVINLLLSSRMWHYRSAPDLGLQISTLIGPILAGIVFVSTVWLLIKVRKRITIGLTESL